MFSFFRRQAVNPRPATSPLVPNLRFLGLMFLLIAGLNE
jgi:hypothetical protein